MAPIDLVSIVLFVVFFAGFAAWMWRQIPGDELASADFVPGEAFALEATAPSDASALSVWVELDITYPPGARISGPVRVTAGGRTVLEKTLALGHGRRIVEGPPSGFRYRYMNQQTRSPHRIRGHIRLVRLTGDDLGGTIQVDGTPTFGPGPQGTVRIYVCR